MLNNSCLSLFFILVNMMFVFSTCKHHPRRSYHHSLCFIVCSLCRTVRNLMLHGSSSFLIVCLVCPCFSFCLCVMTYVIICLLCVVCHSVVCVVCVVLLLGVCCLSLCLLVNLRFLFSSCKQQPRRSYHCYVCRIVWFFHVAR